MEPNMHQNFTKAKGPLGGWTWALFLGATYTLGIGLFEAFGARKRKKLGPQ